MSGESSQRSFARSNRQGRKFAPKKIVLPAERISFRDIAKLAARRKTIQFLVERTGYDDSTAKRWLSGKSRAADRAVYAVLADIFARIE
jgi:hypothetical protein